MKKLILFLFVVSCGIGMMAQTKEFRGTVYDAVALVPISAVNVRNMNTGQYVFTDAGGVFSIKVGRNDTLIFATSTYRQKMLVIDAANYDRGQNEVLLYHKAFMLQEVRVLALNPTYEGFKRDIANMKLPESYKNLQGTRLSAEERQNATYQEGSPNILKNTKLGSPISYLYARFSKREKTKRLFYEMQSYGDEVAQVPLKYNRELVTKITGLTGKELMEFMVFCRFSYYDLVRWDSQQIIQQIRVNFADYQYYKALEEEE